MFLPPVGPGNLHLSALVEKIKAHLTGGPLGPGVPGMPGGPGGPCRERVVWVTDECGAASWGRCPLREEEGRGHMTGRGGFSFICKALLFKQNGKKQNEKN